MMTTHNGWEITTTKRRTTPKGTLIIGLPGMGNVGKVATDYIIKKIEPEITHQIFSTCFPHSAYITKNGTIRRPEINIHHHKEKNLFFLAGDLQPLGEKECYELTRLVMDLIKPTQIITLGGAGLALSREKPKTYCIGNTPEQTKKYEQLTGAEGHTYGIIGPIVGVAGTFLTEAQQRGIPAVCLAAETTNKECYVGFEGAYQLILALNKSLNLQLDEKIIEQDLATIQQIIKQEIPQKTQKEPTQKKENSYIG